MTTPHGTYETIEAACTSLRARADDIRLVVLPGLADELRIVAAALESLRHASSVQSRAIVRQQLGCELLPSDYLALIDFAREGT